MRVQLDIAHPYVLRPGEGETIFDEPERTLRLIADREQLTVTWFHYEPGQQGPDPHIHRRHTDAFYVLEGELEFGLGPEVTRLVGGAGTLADAIVRGPGEGDSLGAGASSVLFKAEGGDGEGTFSLTEITLEPGFSG